MSMFLTGVDIEKKEQKPQPLVDEQPPQIEKQEIPEKKEQPQNNLEKKNKNQKLEPLNNPNYGLNSKQQNQTKAQTTKNQPTKQKRQSVQAKTEKLAPIKKNNYGDKQILSQTIYNSKSTQHLGEHKLKSFKSVMDFVKDGKQPKKEKQHNLSQPDSREYLSKYKEKIVKDIENIYSQSEYSKVLEELVRLENKQFVQSEINRLEHLINKKKTQYNNTTYEVMLKQKKLKGLENEIKKCQGQLSVGGQIEDYDQAIAELKDLQSQYDDLNFRRESLQHMVYDRKKRVNNAQKDLESLYTLNKKAVIETIRVEEILIKQGKNPQERQKNIEELKLLLAEYQKALKYEKVVMGQHFEDQLEDELSEYEDKRALKQIFKHEARRKEEAERDKQEHREQQLQKTREEKKKEQDKINKEMQEIKQVLNQEIEKFQKLEKATGIRVDMLKDLSNADYLLQQCQKQEDQYKTKQEEDDLRQQIKIDTEKLAKITGQKIDKDVKLNLKFDKNIYILYKESLTRDYKHMKTHFKKKFEEKIGTTKQSIVELKEKIQLFKYGEKPGEKQNDPNLIETLEQTLIEERDLTQDKENQLRRVEKVIDNICIVISRISYQLPFGKQNKDRNVKVLRDHLLDQISICGLQLEKMLAILSKKKDTIRIESVNTASDNKSPPDYLGLNNKIIKSIQQENPKYNYDNSQRIDNSLNSMDNFPVQYMGIQQYIYAGDRLQQRQVFDYEPFPENLDDSKREEDIYFEKYRNEVQQQLQQQSKEL